MNAALLHEAMTGTVAGGGCMYLEHRAASSAAKSKRGPVTGGAMPLPVHPDGHGGHAVDVQEMSDAYLRLAAVVAENGRTIADLRNQVSTLQAHGPQPSAQRPPFTAAAAFGNGRGADGRAGGRARGRGGRGGGRGGGWPQGAYGGEGPAAQSDF